MSQRTFCVNYRILRHFAISIFCIMERVVMKKYVLDGAQMKEVDRYSIEEKGIPSLVLMERAALSVCQVISGEYGREHRVLFVCSCGNNGADGLAAARILHTRGWQVEVCIVGGRQKATAEFDIQLNICEKLGVSVSTSLECREYDIIVDAIFGIGLSRNLEGSYADVVFAMNSSGKEIVSVDIPSGIDASSGRIMGTAVKAKHTVTFGYMKTGQLLYPGAEYVGKLHLMEDVGFAADWQQNMKIAFTCTPDYIEKYLPERTAYSNKGTYGRTLVVAGSEKMAGAAYLSGSAAYKTGTGLVKILTDKVNRDVIMQLLPEAVTDFYNEDIDVERQLQWMDAMVIGPGLSVNEMSKKLVKQFLQKNCDKLQRRMVVDADALNIIAQMGWHDLLQGTIVTPHLGEMARLTRGTVEQIQNNLVQTAVDFARKYRCICVLKDARTIVTNGERVYINSTGNNGMATGGSGDVLTGILAGLLAQNMDCFEAAWLGTCIHGISGDMAALKVGRNSMTARDILNGISGALLDGH